VRGFDSGRISRYLFTDVKDQNFGQVRETVYTLVLLSKTIRRLAFLVRARMRQIPSANTRAGQFINHKLAPVQSAPSEARRACVEDWHAQTVLVQGPVNLGSKGFRPRVKSSTCSAIPAEAQFYFPHNYIA
jgi:hypothetical protein